MTTVVVTLCDAGYFGKAKNTICDIRSRGQWQGPIVLVAVDFAPDAEFVKEQNVQVTSFPRIPLDHLLDAYRRTPLSNATHDGREFKKTTQWEKLHLFDPFFKQWERVVYVDAGLRILDSLDNFLCLEWRDRILAQNDAWNDPKKQFRGQLETVNQPDALKAYSDTYGPGVLDEIFFLNCMWIHDTSLPVTKEELIDVMNAYPIWRTNEMGVMNTLFTFKHRVWTPFPLRNATGKFLFDWCELNRPGTHWTQYCALKYPVTLK
jgi:hypothetical protein